MLLFVLYKCSLQWLCEPMADKCTHSFMYGANTQRFFVRICESIRVAVVPAIRNQPKWPI